MIITCPVTGVNKYYRARKHVYKAEESNVPFGKHQRCSHPSESTVEAFVKPVLCILKKNGKKVPHKVHYGSHPQVSLTVYISSIVSSRKIHFPSHIVLYSHRG